MDGNARREYILKTLREATGPVTAGAFAARLAVSRQAIVQDVALLRAKGADILATPSGYLIPAKPAAAAQRVFTCRHLGREGLRRELEIICRGGGMALDVIVEHPVYGEFRAMLMIRDERGIRDLEERLTASGSAPLSSLTGGRHLHTVEAADEAALDAIEAALYRAGILVDARP